jgi:uncharacterized membrane protein YdjX (TVP38/TMEM64 family)
MRLGRRRSEFLLAVAAGWIPGLVVRTVLGSVDPRASGAILAACVVGVTVYAFRSLRRFDREGRERYVTRTIVEGQERLDSLS